MTRATVFDHDELQAIATAAEATGLTSAESRVLLVPCELLSNIPTAPIPAHQIQHDLAFLNRLPTPGEGAPFISQWLAMAVSLAGPQLGAEVLAGYLARSQRRAIRPTPVPGSAGSPARQLEGFASAMDDVVLLLGPWLLRPGWWRAVAERLRLTLQRGHGSDDDVARLAGLYVETVALQLGNDRRAAQRQLTDEVRRLAGTCPDVEAQQVAAAHLAGLGMRRVFTTAGAVALEGVEVVQLHGQLDRAGDPFRVQDIDIYNQLGAGYAALIDALHGGARLLCLGFSAADLRQLDGLHHALAEVKGRGAAVLSRGADWEASQIQALGIEVITLDLPWSESARGWSWALSSLRALAGGEAVTYPPEQPESGGPSPVDAVMQVVRGRVRREGMASPAEWFRVWPPEAGFVRTAPPRHPLLDSVYVERGWGAGSLREITKADLVAGRNAGLTGLAGMGGVGKTYLAMRIAHDLYETGWRVLWVPLLEQSVADVVGALAQAMGLDFVHGLTLQEQAAAIGAAAVALAATPERTLVVLDNAERFEDLGLIVRQLGPVRVLVTSRTEEYRQRIPYRRLHALGPDEALSLCQQYLAGRDPGRFEGLGTEDLADLSELCVDVLGGHPLAIQLAMSGFVALSRVRRSSLRPFRALVDRIAAAPLEALPDGLETTGVAGERLHRNIRSTFLWVYGELPMVAVEQGVHAQVGADAQALLPIVAGVAFAPAAEAVIHQAVEAVAQRLETDGATRLIDAKATQAALELLVEVSLVELAEGAPARYWVHPLVREFAFAFAEDEAAEGTSLRVILGASHAVLVESGLLALLPRMRRIDALGAEICEAALEWWVRGQQLEGWSSHDAWLQEALVHAERADLPSLHARLMAQWGELRLRMEDPEAVAHLSRALSALEAVGSERAGESARWVETMLVNRIDDDARSRLIAARQLWRRLLAHSARYNATNVEWKMAGWGWGQTEGALLQRTTLTPDVGLAALDLSAQMNHAILGGWYEYLPRLRALFERARPSADVTVEFEIEALAGLLALEGLAQGHTEAAVAAEFAQLEERARGAGFRAYSLQLRLCTFRYRAGLRAGDWRGAVDAAKQALTVPDGIYMTVPGGERLTARVWLAVAQTAAGETLDPAASASLAEAIERWGRGDLVPWLCLVHAGETTGVAAATHLVRARHAFRSALGRVPPEGEAVYRALVARLDAGPMGFEALRDEIEPGADRPPAICSWRLPLELPGRVRASDGRPMRRVVGGLQPRPLEGQVGWWPDGYLDEVPVTIEAFERFLDESGRAGLQIEASGPYVAGISCALAAEYAAWAGKTLPLVDDWYVATWQHGVGHAPVRWSTWPEVFDGVLDTVERVLDGADLSAENRLPTGSGAVGPAPTMSDIEAHFGAEWLSENDEVRRAFEAQIVLPAVLAGFGPARATRLAEGLAASISQSPAERRLIIGRIPKLKSAQVDELIGVFKDEHDKFVALDDDHVPEVATMAVQRHGELLSLLVPDRVCFRGVSREALRGVWSGMMENEALSGTVLVGDPFTADTWQAPTAYASHYVGIQCAKHVFMADDLADLSPTDG